VSQLDPRLSKVVTAHSSIVAALNVIHSLRTRGLRRTLLFGALGNAIPILGELLAIRVLKVIRHHIQPQTRGVPLAIALGWYNVGYGTLAAVNGAFNDGDKPRVRKSLAPTVALAATSLDLLLDPFGLNLGLWEWSEGGSYASEVRGLNDKRGILLLNFAGWIALTSGVMLQRRSPTSAPMPARYARRRRCRSGAREAPCPGERADERSPRRRRCRRS
jgi:uncharacterized membrane protein